MAGPIGATIDDEMVVEIVAKHRLPMGISRSEVIRYCLARLAGNDHYDSLRIAEKPRLEALERRAKTQENGLTKVSAEVPDSLLIDAKTRHGISNTSQLIRFGMAWLSGFSEDEALSHAKKYSAKSGRPRKQVAA
jgi:hypothetical protein